MNNIVFVDRGTFPSHLQTIPTDNKINWTEHTNTSPSDVIEHCQNANIILTNKVVFSAETLHQLPNLKLICVTATGTNNIDLNTCRELGIQVVNATNYGTQSVAEHCLMLMLNLQRNFRRYDAANRDRHWAKSPYFHDPIAPIGQLAGKTLTIVGKGTLGNKVAELARAFGMNVLFAERSDTNSARTGYLPFEQALQLADFVSLHCPLNDATQNLLNRTTMALLKPSSFIINCGRGGLVNEADLLHALQQKQLAGAALDVATTEPPGNDDIIWQLAEREDVILTPHVAWASDEAMGNLLAQIHKKIALYLNGELLENLAQP